MRNTILLVEDDEEWGYLIKLHIRALNPTTNIVLATNMAEARQCIQDLLADPGNHEHIIGIIMDGCLRSRSRECDTEALVAQIRVAFSFTGLIIANSIREDYNKLLEKVGCDYSVCKGAFSELCSILKARL